MNYGRDSYERTFNSTDDSITVSEPFANSFIAKLWNNATGKRKAREVPGGRENSFHH
jgi:hypothetical protein